MLSAASCGMTDIQDIQSGVSNNTVEGDKFRDTFDAIGPFADDAADAITGFRSSVSLMKGICSGLGVPAGTLPPVDAGSASGNPNLLDDGLAAIGTQEDTPAAQPEDVASAVSVAKGILTLAGFV